MKKPKAPRLVTVAITTTITVIFWIFFTLYQVLTTKPAPSVEPELLEPIDPALDINSLESIKERVFFEEGSVVPLKRPEPPEDTEVTPTENPVPEEATAEASTNENEEAANPE